MNKVSEDVTGKLLDSLIAYGDDIIAKSSGSSFVASALKEVTGRELRDDDTGFGVLEAVRPILMSKLDEVSAEFALKAGKVIEDNDSELLKRSFLSAWPDLATGAKVIVYGILAVSLGATGLSAVELYKAEAITLETLLFTVGIPSATLIVLATLPIKSVAYIGLHAATKLLDKKLKKK